MPFEIAGAIDMTTASVLSQNFKIAILGEPGDGKSWLAASCATKEEPAYHFDFDGRKQSIAGKPYVTSKSYDLTLDAGYPMKMPMAWQTLNTDIMAMEKAKAAGELPWKWFIPDSATFLSAICMNYQLYHSPAMRREVRAGNSLTYIPKSYDAYKAELADVTSFLSRLMCLGNVIMTFHIDNEKDQVASTPEAQKYTGKKTVAPPRYANLLALFNDQWWIKAKGPGKYEVQTQPNYQFIAKNTMLLDPNEEPDIRKMMSKYMTKAKQVTK